MVDDCTRPKLGDRQEAWPGEIFVALLGAPTWNIGRQRQAWEVVTWEKALAGKIAVTVEIGLFEARHIRQECKL